MWNGNRTPSVEHSLWDFSDWYCTWYSSTYLIDKNVIMLESTRLKAISVRTILLKIQLLNNTD